MPLTTYKRGRFWWLTGTIKTKTGEQRIHESTGETDEAAADEVRESREAEARAERLSDPKSRFTFAQATNAYLEAGKGDRFVKPLLLHFAETRISEMTGAKIRTAAKKLYPGKSYATWNRQVITPVKSIINFSADAGDCDPIKIKGFSKRDRDVKISDTPPRRAVDRSYIDAFRKHSDDPRLSALLLFMFQTGARISDALKLEDGSDDIDLTNRKVTFRDMKNGEDGEADLTIELVYEIQTLREWKRLQIENWRRASIRWKATRRKQEADGRFARKPNTRLFGYVTRTAVYKDMRRICAAAGIPYLGTHQPGRHSFATEMIVKNRVDVATTAGKGRWKSKQLLMSNYAHGDTGKGVIDKVFGSKRKRA